jgi:hypothetical protein
MAIPRAENLGEPLLTADSFPEFYRTFMSLRFPLAVTQVIEIRDLIHQALDTFMPSLSATDHENFQSELRSVVESLGITSPHQSEAMLRVAGMFSELHHQHVTRSREAEERLRAQQIANRAAKRASIKFGAFALVATFIGGLAWLLIEEGAWFVGIGTLLFGYLSLDYFYSLSVLKQEYEHLGHELAKLCEARIGVMAWKSFLHRVASVLGYMSGPASEAFLADDGL